MDLKLKQRLIGAVILISLGVIILPWLLDGSEAERLRIQAEIPEPPEIQLEEITLSGVSRKIEQMAQASKTRLPKEIADETDYADKPDFIFDKNNLPVNWSIQIGSFESEQNAIRLREKLRKSNYRAYILYVQTGEGGRYRVFVGPSSSRETLTEFMAQIEASLDIKGNIVRYRIEEDRNLLGG